VGVGVDPIPIGVFVQHLFRDVAHAFQDGDDHSAGELSVFCVWPHCMRYHGNYGDAFQFAMVN
jgi:hypothetical protein